jgi:hypothetical protein
VWTFRAAAILASGDFVFIDDFAFDIDGLCGRMRKAARVPASSCLRRPDDHFGVSGKLPPADATSYTRHG